MKYVLKSSLMRRGIENRLRRGGKVIRSKTWDISFVTKAIGMWQASKGKGTDAYLSTVAKLIGLSSAEWSQLLGPKEITIDFYGHSLTALEFHHQTCSAFKFQRKSPIMPGPLILFLCI